MKTPTISIIVPVYKVEKYLSACIESILAQTFQDFELILVDDGSPDDCPAMCDAYAEKDARIRVIHQKNGGLSAARNAGLDVSGGGGWIGFVDSDDTIAPEMYEMLYRLATEHHADMAVCSFLPVDEQGKPMEEARKEPQTVVYTQEQAISRIATGDFQPAWNKLYRKEIFAELRYPEGKLNEDTFLLPHVMEQVTRVAHTRQQYYYYRQRKNSIMGEKKRLKNYDAVEAAYGCWQYLLYNGKTEALTAGAKFVLGSTRMVYCGLSPKDRKAPRSKEMMKLQRGVAWCTFRAGAFSIELLLRTVFFQLCPMGYGVLQKWWTKQKNEKDC